MDVERSRSSSISSNTNIWIIETESIYENESTSAVVRLLVAIVIIWPLES